MKNKLFQKFHSLLFPFTKNEELINNHWLDLQKQYTQKSRHYHNLTHLQNMFNEMDQCTEKLEDPEILQFSIFYHDIIYKATSKKNEEKSAVFAKRVLAGLGLRENRIKRCFEQIILTKRHQAKATDPIDERFLIDLDLEILSQDWEKYKTYTQQIRKEYSIYPTFVYRKGRKKALKTFLERGYIYKTDKFRDARETKARENIRREIEKLL